MQHNYLCNIKKLKGLGQKSKIEEIGDCLSLKNIYFKIHKKFNLFPKVLKKAHHILLYQFSMFDLHQIVLHFY
jgi:hypothetical protein